MSGIRAGRPARRPPAAAGRGEGGAGPAPGPAAPAPHVGRGRGGAGRGRRRRGRGGEACSRPARRREGAILGDARLSGFCFVWFVLGLFFFFFFFSFNALFTLVQRLCRLSTEFSSCDSAVYAGLGSTVYVQGNILG